MRRYGSIVLGVALLLTGAPAAQAQPQPQVPVQIPTVGACTSLSISFVEGQGAAGTLLDVLALTNTGASSCTLRGYATVQMLDGSGTPMTTLSLPGGDIFTNFPGISTVTVAPGASAPFGISWSDVPVGSETTCAEAASLDVTPPGSATALNIGLPGLAPCNSGRINVGPIRPPGSTIPS